MADGGTGAGAGGSEPTGCSAASVGEAAAKLRGMAAEERAAVKKAAEVAVLQFLVLLEELA